ncbi:MAG: Nramp family divalent metal transporter [Syntrophorhabdaceae bacterium]|nr:Nramp family divalent metal transporter [Syntrophorhabdaceae bacterium]
MAFRFIERILSKKGHRPVSEGLEILRFIGPGFLVTVGFIDPGNWASNVAAGSVYGYNLLWVVTLSTIMLIIIQHNVAHLGIVTGLCLSEASTKFIPPMVAKIFLFSAMVASIFTSFAEIMGASIALYMLFGIPIPVGASFSFLFVVIMLFTNTYSKIERIIIAFVSIIGFSLLFELILADVEWDRGVYGSFMPSIPYGAMPVIMSVLGAVVMPHNLFLHSEVIQSREWNTKDEHTIKRQLDYEMFDTSFSMIVGWAINSAMILLAASVFFRNGVTINELQQASEMLIPLLGSHASIIFAIGLLLSGIASSITSGMAGGTISAGFYGEPYNIKDSHSKIGVFTSLFFALMLVFVTKNPFQGLIYSQMCLSIQLPLTVFVQLYLTSSKRVMGKYVNRWYTSLTMLLIGLIITYFNLRLFFDWVMG